MPSSCRPELAVIERSSSVRPTAACRAGARRVAAPLLPAPRRANRPRRANERSKLVDQFVIAVSGIDDSLRARCSNISAHARGVREGVMS